jgi:Flp pilus assembly protein TadD
MTRNGKITATLLAAAIAAVGCTKDKTSQTDNKESQRSAKTMPVSLPTPVADKSPNGTAARVSGPVSYADGEALFQAGKYVEATNVFEQYTADKPNNPWGHFMLGLSASKVGDTEKAEKSFNEALRIDPDHLKSLLNLSRILIDKGRYDEAIVKLARAGEINPTSAEVHRLLGRGYSGQHKTDDAIDSYRRAIALDATDAWSMNNLGLILIQKGRSFEATPLLAKAVELQKNVPTFHNNLGMALEKTSRFKAAASEYKEALTADPNNAKAKSNLERIEAVKVGSEESFDRAAEAKRAVEVKQPSTESTTVTQ